MNTVRSKYKYNALRKRTIAKKEYKCNKPLSKYSNKEEYDSAIEIPDDKTVKSKLPC